MKDILKANRIEESMKTVLGERDAALALEAARTGKVTMEAVQAREEIWT